MMPYALALIFVLSTSDIYFNFSFGGNFRSVFLAIPILFVFFLCKRWRLSSIQCWFLAFGVVFLSVDLIFGLFSLNLLRSFAFSIFFALCILLSFFVSLMVSNSFSDHDFRYFAKWSIIFFSLLSVYQVASFYLSSDTWIFSSTASFGRSFPRVSGLSYEPSFFAAYISPLFVFFLFGGDRKPVLWGGLSFLILIFSGSRIAWVAAMILILVFGLRRHGLRFFAWAIIVVPIVLNFVVVIFSPYEIDVLLSGVNPSIEGFGHSYQIRMSRAWETLSLFLQSPFAGVSLGGVGPQIAHEYYGIDSSGLGSFPFEGNVILFELFAAWGVFGIFCIFAFAMFAVSVYRHNDALAGALGLGVLVCFLCLVPNQVILRPALWVWLGVWLGSACRRNAVRFL